MALLVVFKGNGFTKQMYESLRRLVNWESQRPAGGLIHACGFDDAGNLHVADVWNSPEEMNEFVSKRLVPGFQQLQIPMPEVQVMPLHNLNVYPDAAARYQLK